MSAPRNQRSAEIPPFFPRVFLAHSSLVVAFWAVMAAANLAAGVAMTTWADRQIDLDTIRRWGTQWLVEGLNVYAVDWDWPDYPPHALIALSPLSLLPQPAAVPVWAGLNLALALIVPYLAIRAIRPNVTVREALLPMLMFLCWGGFRTLLQFSLLSLTCGLLAMVLADRKPVWSGVALGFALMKPQITFPVLLWALFARRMRVVGIALAVVATGFIAFCLRAGAGPLEVIERYLTILRFLYTGNSPMRGAAQLRPLFGTFISNVAVVDILVLVTAVILLAAVCRVGFAEGRLGRPVCYSAPAMATLWCLLTFHNLTNSFLMLLPMGAALIYAEERETLALRRRVFWILQLGLMVDVPNLWRRFGYLTPLPAITSDVVMHVDRGVMLVLFGLTFVLALKVLKLREPAPPSD